MITSLENEKVKYFKKLQMKKYRDEEGLYLVEGKHLVEEALKEGCLEEVITTEEDSLFLPNVLVSKEVMRTLSTTDNPPTIMGVCKKKEEEIVLGEKILYLDEIQDPGNLGTLIRSATAFGIDTILLSKNTVDLYNPKVLRSTQGLHFHISFQVKDFEEVYVFLKENEYKIYGTNVEEGVDVRSLKRKEVQKFCLVLGNEGKGVKKEIQEVCDKNLYIPMSENAESLNVGVAGSILLYELERIYE